MADVFELRLVTPRRELLDESVREVTAPGTIGQFGVLPEHVAFLSSLEIGVLTFRTDRGARRVAVRGGFAEVLDNVMTILAEDAQFADDVDAQAARAELTAADTELKDLSPLDESYAAAEARRRWALAKLDATTHA